ncbi:hypothetical protein LRS06_01550 [Hymenobacter sp. J193]|uniref:hypothetical protein n=1 Tax=Hymenobacter sp. J193 TaxID=2898429 RepID=UPI0021509D8E|nr:hypothetical protein [Hymenobacter sp. J193]MCR5886478.1 hypothetical protein [Hymenobacter sp. J193]
MQRHRKQTGRFRLIPKKQAAKLRHSFETANNLFKNEIFFVDMYLFRDPQPAKKQAPADAVAAPVGAEFNQARSA